MPREKLMPFYDDDRDFEEQMDALGVEVVKPKTEVKWYKPHKASSSNAGLKDKISITVAGVTLGSEVVQMLGADSRLKVAVVKTKKINGLEKITIAIKTVNKGLKIITASNNTRRVGTKNMMKWLFENGVKKGRYNLKKIDGGYLAVGPVEGGVPTACDTPKT